MLPFGVTIPGSEIPEGLMNNPVFITNINGVNRTIFPKYVNVWITTVRKSELDPLFCSRKYTGCSV